MNIKSFLYCNEPNDWGFHMGEKVDGVPVAVGTYLLVAIWIHV